MRFNKEGEGICQNYHPDYLKNLARSLGYGNFRVDQKQTGNMCKMVWLDGCGKFQTNNKGGSAIEKPYKVTFWGPPPGKYMSELGVTTGDYPLNVENVINFITKFVFFTRCYLR